ncbi:MAG: hypothetical protein ABUL67_01370 [Haliangium ochraceum]
MTAARARGSAAAQTAGDAAERGSQGRASTHGPRSSRRGAAAVMTAALALATALATGCPKHLPLSRAYPPPPAGELARVFQARQRAVSTMNARARATSWLDGDRVRATVLMLVHRAGRLRLEAEVSLQGTVAVLATDGQRFAFLDTMKNELRHGPACPANVASLIRIPLAPADVAAILLGDVRLPDGADLDAGVVDWDADRGADVLAVRRHDGWLRLLFQRPGGAIRLVGALATGPDGRARWRVAFEEFGTVTTAAPATTILLPGTIRFAEGDASFDDGVEIKFKERAVNEPVADDVFALPTPPGTTTFEVACPPGAPPAR